MIGLADESGADCCAVCWLFPCAAMSGAGMGVRIVPCLVLRGPGEVASAMVLRRCSFATGAVVLG